MRMDREHRRHPRRKLGTKTVLVLPLVKELPRPGQLRLETRFAEGSSSRSGTSEKLCVQPLENCATPALSTFSVGLFAWCQQLDVRPDVEGHDLESHHSR